MAKKKDVFADDLIILLDTLAELEFLTATVEWTIGRFGAQAEETLATREASKEFPDLPKAYFLGQTLSVPNLFGGKSAWRPHRPRMEKDEVLLGVIRETAQRLYAYCLCLAFEAMELFLKKALGLLLHELRGEISLRKKSEFRQRRSLENGTGTYHASQLL